MAEDNFALIVVGVVAVVAIVGLLNINGMTGKGIIQTATEKEAYQTQWECEKGNNVCIEDWIEVGKELPKGFSGSKIWKCPWDVDKNCYHLYYRIS